MGKQRRAVRLIGGLIQSNVYEEVPWERLMSKISGLNLCNPIWHKTRCCGVKWMSGVLIRARREDSRRPGKYKSRLVAQGSHAVGDGLQFGDAATSIASATAFKYGLLRQGVSARSLQSQLLEGLPSRRMWPIRAF